MTLKFTPSVKGEGKEEMKCTWRSNAGCSVEVGPGDANAKFNDVYYYSQEVRWKCLQQRGDPGRA